VQTSARENTKYSRNETILKSGRHANNPQLKKYSKDSSDRIDGINTEVGYASRMTSVIFSCTNSAILRTSNMAGLVHFTDPQSMDYHERTTVMDYLNGRLNGPPQTTHLEKKKENQSLVVLIDNSKDSINERFGRRLTSGRSQKLTH